MSEELRWVLLGFGAALLAWIYGVDRWRRSRGPRSGDYLPTPDPSAASGGAVDPATVPVERTVPMNPLAERDPFDAADSDSLALRTERRTGERRRRSPSLAADADIDTRPIDTRPIDTRPIDTRPIDTRPVDTRSSELTRRVPLQDHRKIITLRLVAGQAFDGQLVCSALESMELRFGKYAVFHRLMADEVSVFSVASMTEPGTFDIERMRETRLAGLILYALLPGPLDGPATFTQLLNAATQLQQAIGGELQDERGVTLTSYRINRIREEVAEFRAL